MESQGHSFDLMTFRDRSTVEAVDDSGVRKQVKCNERYYTPTEITWYLKSLHFKQVDIYSCRTGKFSRNDPLRTDDFEMLVIAERTKGGI